MSAPVTQDTLLSAAFPKEVRRFFLFAVVR